MLPKDDELYIEVIGGGDIGETIILRLPDGNYGLVDCFSKVVPNSADNQIVKRLRELNVDALDFVVLTHPHADHFRGMYQVLVEFPPRQFWKHSGSSRAMWDFLLLYLEAEALDNSVNFDKRDVKELFNILRFVGERQRDNLLQHNLLVGIQQVRNKQLTIAGSTYDLSITSISPDATIIDKFERDLAFRCRTLPPFIGPDAQGRKPDLNDLSAALIIQFGSARVLLGSDVTKETWEAILRNQSDNQIDLGNLAFVKVCHHGSKNGYCDGLWSLFAEGGPPVAGLTPYKTMLPAAEAIDHIKQHAERIMATGIRPNNPNFGNFKFAGSVSLSVLATTNVIAASADPIIHGGSFRISINVDGEITEQEFIAAAQSY